MDSSNILTCLPHVEWREIGEDEADDANWEREKTCPRTGELRWANILTSHETQCGERAWLLYQPALSMLNGWDVFPLESDESAIVECEIQQKILYSGWAQVICHLVVPLWQIPDYFPETRITHLPTDLVNCYEQWQTGTTDRLLYMACTENGGEAREWWVIAKTTPRRVVLYSFEIGCDPCEIHNAILPDGL